MRQVRGTLAHDCPLHVLALRLSIVSASFPDTPSLHLLPGGHEWRRAGPSHRNGSGHGAATRGGYGRAVSSSMVPRGRLRAFRRAVPASGPPAATVNGPAAHGHA